MEEIIQTLQNNAKDEQGKDLTEEDEGGEDSKPGMLGQDFCNPHYDIQSNPKSIETDLKINVSFAFESRATVCRR